MNHGRRAAVTAILAAGLLLGAVAGLSAQDQPATPPALPVLQAALRDLWMGHIFWVRNYVLTSRLSDTAAATVAEGQVVQNARAIADAISPYYGKAAADKLFSLLAAHYGAIKEYMNAAYAGKAAARTAAVQKLNANADEIATFLSSANPNWPRATLVGALRAHGAHHVMQIDAFYAKDYKTEADVWSQMTMHIYTIADVLAQGIEKQFGSSAQ